MSTHLRPELLDGVTNLSPGLQAAQVLPGRKDLSFPQEMIHRQSVAPTGVAHSQLFDNVKKKKKNQWQIGIKTQPINSKQLVAAASLVKTKPHQRRKTKQKKMSCSPARASLLPIKLRFKREMSCRVSWLRAATWSLLCHFLCFFFFSLPPMRSL